MSTHVVMGIGDAPESVITEGLRDVLKEGDDIAFAWVGSPVPKSLEAVYGYVLDNEVQFTMYYTDGQKIPGAFREADHGMVVKTRDIFSSLVKSVSGNVLYLWDDGELELAERIFDSTECKILELSNGLVPIVLEEAPAPELVEDVHDDDDDDDDDMRFTMEQLESMTVPLVKRYGERMGCTAKTKAGIISELFPPTEVPSQESPAPVEVSEDRNNISFEQEMVTLIHNFYEHYKPGFETDMAHLALGQARLWMLKVLSS